MKIINNMDKNLIKKELYKQKPIADLNRIYEGYKQYTCQLIVDGQMKVVFFDIPIKECDFEEVVPAQLLIQWMI